MPILHAQADRTSALRHLIDTLFDFESLPGRYPLSLREPRILFDGSHDVLLLAAGRPIDGLAPGIADMPHLKRAACFFIRIAMLRPGADHYTVLGLEPGFSQNSLRLHYRMLIRLTHPDFVGNGNGNGNGEVWPTGSATRINLAHDVLSSAIRRAEYSQTLSGSEKHRILLAHSLVAVLPRPVAYGNRFFKNRAWAFVCAGFIALLLLGTLCTANFGDTDQGRVARIELPDSPGAAAAEFRNSARSAVQGESASAPTVSASSSGSADKASKDLRATLIRDDDGSAANQQAQQARQVQVVSELRDAKNSETAKLAQAEKLAELAEQAKLTQTVLVPQAPKTAQASLEFKAVKSTQLTQLIQEPQLTLTTRLPGNPEVLITEVASVTGNAAPVKLLLIQPMSDSATKPNLVDAQPALNQLIQSMQAGRGDDLLRGLERSVSRSSGASDLVNAYNLLIGGSRSVRVGRVQLRSRPTGDHLTVDGMVQLILQDQGQPLPVRELQLRAAFVMRDGQVVMTELSTSGSKP